MAIVNRDVDASQQNEVVQVHKSTIPVTTLVGLFIAPFPCTIQTLKYAAVGLSGSPIWTFGKQSMAGSTVAIGISGLVVQAVGTSGAVNFSGLAASGSTLLNLAMGDYLYCVTSGANTALTDMVMEIVVKKTQDIVSYN